MVQTRSAAKRTESEKANENDGVLPAATVKLPPVPVKRARQRVAAAPKKCRRGKAVELCQLNLDVLFLIAAYIHPMDILNLARTCKSLRELLMDKSSAFVWKTARQQVERLPECPADLTEPEYANLAFCACCHGCGKYTTTILWNIRRRYCPDCRRSRLRRFASSAQVIRTNKVLPSEYLTLKQESTKWLDKDQVASFMHEYRQSPDKTQFISDKQKQFSNVLQHAKKCEAWQKRNELERKVDRKWRQEERERRIFQRLEEKGYEREITYFGPSQIRLSRDSDFRTSKPLTDREWDRMLPEWITTMNGFRSGRMETVLYKPRRRSLGSAYWRYVACPSSDAPSFDLLPHVADVGHFSPFREIINAPEDILVNDESFASALAQLPMLVAEWRKKVDAELAELVKIPSHLSSKNASIRRVQASSSTAGAKLPETDLSKLELACAMFHVDRVGIFTHPDVFLASTAMNAHPSYIDDGLERLGSISERFGIQFLKEAPYIVQVCGLDPNVATVDDMDRRNARLTCLCCSGLTNVIIVNWRNAMRHALTHSRHAFSASLPVSKSPRWQLIGDEHIDAIQTVEQFIINNNSSGRVRCLFCRPRVGDAMWRTNVSYHLPYNHNVRKDDVKQGVHFTPIGICDSYLAVDMVEEGEQVTFKVPSST